MTTWSKVTIGRMQLLEGIDVAEAGGDGLKLSVQAPAGEIGNLSVERLYADLLGVAGELVPVRFGDKTFLDGYYRITEVDLTHSSYPAGVLGGGSRLALLGCDLTLVRAGTTSTVDLESRLSGPQTRTNAHAATGDVWHAPPIGHRGYLARRVGSARYVLRGSEDGTIIVYRDVLAGSSPRWMCTPQAFAAGRARFLDAAGEERSGTDIPSELTTVSGGLAPGGTLPPSGSLLPDGGVATVQAWTVTNGLIRVAPLSSGGLFSVSAYSGASWSAAKSWDVLVNGSAAGPLSNVTLLRNTFDTVTLRMFVARLPGRFTIDVTVKRGARFAEIAIASSTTATLTVTRGTAEAGTAGAGYVAAAGNDGDGHRYVVGSAASITASTTAGAVSTTGAAATMDALVGVVVSGSGAIVGDTAADLFAQYLGSPVETVTAVRR